MLSDMEFKGPEAQMMYEKIVKAGSKEESLPGIGMRTVWANK
jgi:hypothetical protein